MPILTSADYPSVRALIQVGLSAESLPDSVIALDVYQGAAEREVKRLDPDWATRAGDELLALKSAAAHFAAAALIPAVRQKIREVLDSNSFAGGGIGVQQQWTQTNTEKRAAELRTAGAAMIADYMADEEPALSATPPSLFGKAAVVRSTETC